MNRKAHRFVAATLFGLLSQVAAAELAVIVDESVRVDSLDLEQLERLYLDKPVSIQASTQLVPLDQRKGSAVRKEFVQKALGKSEAELTRYWSRRMFSGKGQPPREYDGDAAVVGAVTADPGRLGYVDAESVNEQTKVILRIP